MLILGQGLLQRAAIFRLPMKQGASRKLGTLISSLDFIGIEDDLV